MRIKVTREGTLFPVLLDREITVSEYAAIANLLDPVPAFVRPGSCQHPTITDQQLADREDKIAATWGDADHLKCPDCDEYLYPYDDTDNVTVYVGEPFGAGADPFGRPSPRTHPEYWTE